MKNTKVKVGDKIVQLGRVYNVFKIEKRKTNNQEERVILFRPYFKTEESKNIVLTIPEANLARANIREPISKKELKLILAKLAEKPKKNSAATDETSEIKKISLDIISVRELLNQNDPFQSVQVLKLLWREKIDKTTDISNSKYEIFNLAMDRLVEEVAFSSKLSLAKAKEKIKKALAKMLD